MFFTLASALWGSYFFLSPLKKCVFLFSELDNSAMKLLGSDSAGYCFCLFSFAMACFFLCFLVSVRERVFPGVSSVDSWEAGVEGGVGASRENWCLQFRAI